MLILGKEEKGLGICAKVYDLIYELNKICPSVLLAVLPQLECKLKSGQEQERLGAVALLARMFSEKDSQLARQHQSLWRAFLGRYVFHNYYFFKFAFFRFDLNYILFIFKH